MQADQIAPERFFPKNKKQKLMKRQMFWTYGEEIYTTGIESWGKYLEDKILVISGKVGGSTEDKVLIEIL